MALLGLNFSFTVVIFIILLLVLKYVNDLALIYVSVIILYIATNEL